MFGQVYLTVNSYAVYSVGDTLQCELYCDSDVRCHGANVFFSARAGRFVCELMGEVPDTFIDKMASNEQTLGFLRGN